jgi:hypothetical protein
VNPLIIVLRVVHEYKRICGLLEFNGGAHLMLVHKSRDWCVQYFLQKKRAKRVHDKLCGPPGIPVLTGCE